jgi:hypothetical protein
MRQRGGAVLPRGYVLGCGLLPGDLDHGVARERCVAATRVLVMMAKDMRKK